MHGIIPQRPPRLAHGGTVKQPASRFSTLSTLAGYEVIDHDGRPVSECEFQYEADRIAGDLNRANFQGSESLAIALGCVEDEAV